MLQLLLEQVPGGGPVGGGVFVEGDVGREVERGQVLAQPKSITPHTTFYAEVYVLRKDEGGRHSPFFSGYRPQFYIRTMDVTGEITLPEGVELTEVILSEPIPPETEQLFGITLITIIQKDNKIDLNHFLFGNVLGVTLSDV